MKLLVDRAILLKALAHGQSVVERRSTIPILLNAMISADDGRLVITTTDMEITVTEQVAAETERRGACTAPITTLFEIVRKLPEGAQIELVHPGENEPLTLRAGRYVTSLMALPVADFPSTTIEDLPSQITLSSGVLRGLIDRTKFAISTEETRYYLNGVYIHAAIGNEFVTLRAVATDGHRLAQAEAILSNSTAGFPDSIVPRKAVIEVRKLLDDVSENVEISLSNTRIHFRLGQILVTSKLIDGAFPDYEKVIPRENKNILRVSKEIFSDSIGRVAAISSERSRPIKLSLAHAMLCLSAASADSGSATEEIASESFQYEGVPLEIGFQARYLNDITEQLGNKVVFQFSDGSSPTLVRDGSDPSVLYVLMPMRV